MTGTPPGRRRDDGAPQEGTPEFEWLYGGTGARGSADDPADDPADPNGGKHRAADATRALPQQPRPTQPRPTQPRSPEPRAQQSPTPGLDAARAVHDAARSRPQDSRSRPEETKVMPILPPSQARAAVSPRDRRAALKAEQERQTAERSSRATPPPLAPTPGQGRKRRGFRFRFRYVFLLLLLWLVFLVLVPLIAWNKVSKLDAMPSGERPGDQPGTTYLLVGSDSRADLSEQERKELGTGNAGGGRTDTIMLLHTGSGPNLLMSIPRDSLVPIPGRGTTKINAAYAYGGPQLLVRTIETNTGIHIDNYVEIGFGGFVGLVDAVGGIEICPKEDMVDADADLRIKKGCQDVDGKVALAYARSRHAQQLGDLDRAANQREVVAAVGKKAVSPWSVVNPLRYWNLNMAAADFVAIDGEMGPVAAAQFALAMTRVGDGGLTCGVPISDLAVHWDEERSARMFQHIQEDDTAGIGRDLCSPSGLAR